MQDWPAVLIWGSRTLQLVVDALVHTRMCMVTRENAYRESRRLHQKLHQLARAAGERRHILPGWLKQQI